jgi:hypothetical protein
MKNWWNKILETMGYGCGFMVFIISIAFWVCFFLIMEWAFWYYPIPIAIFCASMAVLVFLIGVITKKHSRTLRR